MSTKSGQLQSQPHEQPRVAFFQLQLRGRRISPLPKGYPKEPKTLGQHLRRRRLDRAQTQRTLADWIGVTAESIANWERGRTNPGIRHVAAVIRYLGYDPTPEGDDLAGRLRAMRRRTGLTQREVAARLGLDEGTVVEFELGRRRVSRRVARAVERCLKGVVDDSRKPVV